MQKSFLRRDAMSSTRIKGKKILLIKRDITRIDHNNRRGYPNLQLCTAVKPGKWKILSLLFGSFMFSILLLCSPKDQDSKQELPRWCTEEKGAREQRRSPCSPQDVPAPAPGLRSHFTFPPISRWRQIHVELLPPGTKQLLHRPASNRINATETWTSLWIELGHTRTAWKQYLKYQKPQKHRISISKQMTSTPPPYISFLCFKHMGQMCPSKRP